MNDKLILSISPLGGLCNRMRVIDSALTLADQIDAEIHLYWRLDKDFGCFFDSLWERPERIKKIVLLDLRRVGGRLKRLIVENIIKRRSAYFLPAVEVDRLLAQNESDLFINLCRKGHVFLQSCHRFFPSEQPFEKLIPIRTIREIINVETADFDNVVGVHIRRTDNEKAIDASPTKLFVEKMHEVLKHNPRTTFFLATDSYEEQEFLIGKFPGRIRFYCKSSLNRGQEKVIQDALVDLCCLSRCRKLIGSYWSSFTDTAWQMNGIEHTIIKV